MIESDKKEVKLFQAVAEEDEATLIAAGGTVSAVTYGGRTVNFVEF